MSDKNNASINSSTKDFIFDWSDPSTSKTSSMSFQAGGEKSVSDLMFGDDLTRKPRVEKRETVAVNVDDLDQLTSKRNISNPSPTGDYRRKKSSEDYTLKKSVSKDAVLNDVKEKVTGTAQSVASLSSGLMDKVSFGKKKSPDNRALSRKSQNQSKNSESSSNSEQFQRTLDRKRKRRRKNKKDYLKAIALRILVLVVFILLILAAGKGIHKIMDHFSEPKVKTGSIYPDYVQEEYLTVNPYSRPGIATEKITGIVIHYVANPGTTAKQNRDYFEGLANSGETKASSNFIVGLNGEVIACVPPEEVAYASNTRNLDTISIECCHPDETGEFNAETYETLVNFTAFLCDKYDLKAKDVIRHYDITGKNCPCYYVEHEDAWKQFRKDVIKAMRKL